jgi:hypothetical protein
MNAWTELIVTFKNSGLVMLNVSLSNEHEQWQPK